MQRTTKKCIFPLSSQHSHDDWRFSDFKRSFRTSRFEFRPEIGKINNNLKCHANVYLAKSCNNIILYLSYKHGSRGFFYIFLLYCLLIFVNKQLPINVKTNNNAVKSKIAIKFLSFII